MQTEHYETVWDGSMTGVYLGALKGVEPFLAKPAQGKESSPRHWTPTGRLIKTLLREKGPLTVTQLASACNRAHGETRKCLRRLVTRGTVVLEQPCLLAMAPHSGQRWRLK